MGRIILIVLIVIAVIAAIGGYFFVQANSDDGAVVVDTTTEGGVDVGGDGVDVGLAAVPATPLPPMLDVVVSNQTLPRGYFITEADLTPASPDQYANIVVEKRVASSIGDNVITDISEIVGMYARSDIFQGQTLTEGTLVEDPREAGTSKFGPSSLIPQGQVAAALPFDRLSGVAYGLSEGDYIDIMLTFHFYQIDEEFQTYLQNSAVFYLQKEAGAAAEGESAEAVQPDIMVVSPYGRFEEIPTGDIGHVAPSENQRPIVVSMILQNAKVIQVGDWSPPDSAQVATPTPPPTEGDATPTPESQPEATPTPPPPDVVVLALSPQQQLLLKYAVESRADIDYALRQTSDTQTYSLEAVDLEYMLQRFDIPLPPNFNYSADVPIPTPVPTDAPNEEGS